MLNNKQSENSHLPDHSVVRAGGARKIIIILSAFLLPVVSFAQNYGFRMMDYNNGGYGYNGFEISPILGLILFMPIVSIIIITGLFIFWLLMLIDAIKYSPEKLKIVWVIVIIFTHIIGAIVYYFVEKRPRNKIKTGHHPEHKKEENI